MASKNDAVQTNGDTPHPGVEVSDPPVRFHDCEDGLHIELLPVNAMVLQKVIRKVQLPPRPTYETKTASGKTEHWPMDKESAEQTPGGMGLWEAYLEDRDEALSKQQEVMTEAIVVFGTKCDIPEDGWDEKQKLFDIDVPTQPDMRRAHYILTTRSNDDLQSIIQKVMALTGVDEKKISEAKDSFRDPLRDGSEEPRDMAIAGTN